MERDELLHLSDLNLSEFTRQTARWDPRGELHEHADILLVASSDPYPAGPFNAVMRLSRVAGPDAGHVLSMARRFFEPRQRGYAVHLRTHLDGDMEEACVRAGLAPTGDSPGMACTLPSRERVASPDLEPELVNDADGACDFVHVCGESYRGLGLPSSTVERVFSDPKRLLSPYVKIVVAYVGGKPASAGLLLLSHGVGGIYWVGTVEHARRRGLGRACTQRLTQLGFEMGARAVFLQASRQGESIYRRMGFEEITRYPWYVAYPPSR